MDSEQVASRARAALSFQSFDFASIYSMPPFNKIATTSDFTFAMMVDSPVPLIISARLISIGFDQATGQVESLPPSLHHSR